MKPVQKMPNSKTYSEYGKAKPDLLDMIGGQCSYCERPGDPQDLHVEHIYPKDPHPELEKDWNNFLISCSTCNTYKHHYQGSGKQVDLESKFIWPHRENTFRAFTYEASGEIEIASTVPHDLLSAAHATVDMIGLLRSPAVSQTYQDLGIAYDGANKRSQAWGIVESIRRLFESNPTLENAIGVAENAARIGYFSIWMKVFHDLYDVRRELIRAFKADPTCFDPDTTQPVPKGRL